MMRHHYWLMPSLCVTPLLADAEPLRLRERSGTGGAGAELGGGEEEEIGTLRLEAS